VIVGETLGTFGTLVSGGGRSGAGIIGMCDGCTLRSVAGAAGSGISAAGMLGGSRVGKMSEQTVCCWKMLDSWRNCWHLLSGKGYNGGSWGRVKECLCEVVGCGYSNVGGGVTDHDDSGWKPREGVGYSFCFGGPGPDTVTSIVAEDWAEIPASERVGSPGFTHVGFLINENFGSRRCKGITIEIKSAMHAGLGG
jgi:hypothetical protein